MNLLKPVLAGSMLALCSACVVPGQGSGKSERMPFETVGVHLEQNVTDEDVEAVFEVSGASEGLVKLVVVSPDGRTVIDFAAPDPSTLGIRSFHLESPEPGDPEALKAAYPEGVYRFTGTDAAGVELEGRSTLHHRLPTAASVIQPVLGVVDLGSGNVEIAWTPVGDAAAYIVEISQDDLDMNLEVRLPASAARFEVPGGMLARGVDYDLSIATVSPEGNVTVFETTFTTAE